MTALPGRCGLLGIRSHPSTECNPRWNHLPPDLRRLLAETAELVLAGVDGAATLHRQAHQRADEHRAAS